MATRPPGDPAIPRHASGFKWWRSKPSPFMWARATINGRRWAAPTTVPRPADGHPSDGDRTRFGQEAAALYLEACRQAGSPGAGLPAGVLQALSLGQLVSKYLEHEEAAYTGHDDRHLKRYATDLNCYVLTRWDRVEQITTDSWEQAKRELHKRAGGPLGSRSLAHLANTLRHFLRFCQGAGVVQSVPEIASPSTKDQRAEEGKRVAMTAAQRDRFLKALLQLGEDRAHRIYTVLFWSLLRQNELGALEESWVHWKDEKIVIPPQHSKSGNEEEIDLHPRVRRVLRAQLADNKKAVLRRTDAPSGPEDDAPIFGRFDFHQANTPQLKGGLFGRACLKAKLVTLRADGTVDFRGLTPHHVARHTAATLAAESQETSLAELMALARWRSSAMADRYLHPTVEAGRRASRRL